MDVLIRQMRLRYGVSEKENKEQPSISKERSIPPQQTQSFNGEKNKAQSWFRRSFSQQGGQDDDSEGVEYATAVSAAALAISLLGESGIPDQKTNGAGPKTIAKPEPGRVSRRFSDFISGEASMRNSEGLDRIVPISSATEKLAGKTVEPAPSFRKTPTIAGKQLETNSTTQDTAEPKPEPPAGVQTTGTKRQGSTGKGETKADAWEKAEMDRIKRRYEKLNGTIVSWEENKKKKSRRRQDNTEGELSRRRANTMARYNTEMTRINRIAEAAKAKAAERQLHEESKVKEKANKIRSTGEDPTTCFCF